MNRFIKDWMPVVGLAILSISWFFVPSMFNAIFGLLVVSSFAFFLTEICDRPCLGRIVLFIGCLCVLVVGVRYPHIQFWPYLAIVSANLGIAYVFGNRVFQEKSSILQQIVAIGHSGPELSDKFIAFLDRQCAVWFLFALTLVVASCVAMILEMSRPIVNSLLMLLAITQVIWFVGSHKVAQRKYGRPERWQTTLLLMLKRDLWREMEI